MASPKKTPSRTKGVSGSDEGPGGNVVTPANGPKRVTMRQIAEEAGVHVSTVSIALRNQTQLLPPETIERIKAIARDRQYKPNLPLGQALSAMRRGGASAETLAFLYSSHSRFSGAGSPSALQFSGAVRKAEELGYRVDSFCFDDPKLIGGRLLEVLRTRGIRGVIVSPSASIDDETRLLDFDQSGFVVTAVGWAGAYTEFNRVVPDYLHDVQVTMERLRALGYKRIGFIGLSSENVNTRGALLGSFLLEQLQEQEQVAPLMMKGQFDPGAVISWYEEQRPDVVVSSMWPVAWAQNSKWWQRQIGHAVPMVSFMAQPSGRLSGIVPNSVKMGEFAAEWIVWRLLRGDISTPSAAQVHLVQGYWNAGRSAPARTITPTTSVAARSPSQAAELR